MIIGATLAILVGVQKHPQVEFSLEFSHERSVYYLRVRSLDRRTIYVNRNPDCYLVFFHDAKGEPLTVKQSLYVSRATSSENDWAALAYWDEAAIPLNTDQYFPDPRIKFLRVRLNGDQLVRDFGILKREGPFLRESNDLIFAIPSLKGPARPKTLPQAGKGGRAAFS